MCQLNELKLARDVKYNAIRICFSKTLALWTKKVEYYLTVAVTIHSCVIIRSIFEKEHSYDAIFWMNWLMA